MKKATKKRLEHIIEVSEYLNKAKIPMSNRYINFGGQVYRTNSQGKIVKECEHELIDIVDVYRENKATEVESVECSNCGELFENLKVVLQKKHDEEFRLLGKTPVIFWNSKVKYIKETRHKNLTELKLESGIK